MYDFYRRFRTNRHKSNHGDHPSILLENIWLPTVWVTEVEYLVDEFSVTFGDCLVAISDDAL